MNLGRTQLYRIIVEEYLKEEGLLVELTGEQKDELIAWIQGKGPRPSWATDDLGTSKRGKAIQSPRDPNVDRAADTMPISTDDMPQYDDEDIDDGGAYDPDAEAEVSDIPSDDAPESDYSGFQDRAGPPLEDQIADLIQGMPPEEVSDLFQAVFSKIPGVEIGPPEEEEPETLYNPGAEGRPQISLGPLREAVFKKIMEMGMGSYGLRSMAGIPGNRDDGYENLSDAELIDMAERDGIEEILILDGEGDLVNREEVVAALKNV